MKTNLGSDSGEVMVTTCDHSRMNWPAIVVAALIGVGLSFLITLLSLAFGFTAFSMDTTTGALALSIGGLVGLIVLSILAMFMVGWVAAYLGGSNCLHRYSGELYGLSAWSLTLILTILLSGSVGKFVANTSYLVNKNVMPISFNVAATTVENKIQNIRSNPEKNNEAIAGTTFIVFFIFFIGAISSCFGGRCAQLCVKGYCDKYLKC